MKKKGLIVATIVMVLVLAVSLTTATYAWFTTSSQTTIDSIGIKAAAGADVKIGVKTDNTYTAGASADAFVSGSVNFTADILNHDKGTWAGDAGLGFELSTNLTLNEIAKATGYGTPAEFTYTEDGTVMNEDGHFYLATDGEYYACPTDAGNLSDGKTYSRTVTTGTGEAAQFVPGTSTGKQIVKASGNGPDDNYDKSSVEAATINTDYLHFVLGLAASKEGITSISLNMIVNPGASGTTLGVEGALYFYYKIDNGSWNTVEVYSSYSYTTTKSTISTGKTIGAALNEYYSTTTYSDDTMLNDGYKVVAVTIGDGLTELTVDQVHQIEFYIFYDGTDDDCVNAALGSECEVLFQVTDTEVTA